VAQSCAPLCRFISESVSLPLKVVSRKLVAREEPSVVFVKNSTTWKVTHSAPWERWQFHPLKTYFSDFIEACYQDFGPVYERLGMASDIEPFELVDSDSVLTRGTLSHFARSP
jgi:hypothetical protein